jgi:dihydrofolate reductase
MNHFVEMTTGHIVIVGSKTFLTFPESRRPLPDRINIVISRDKSATELGLTDNHAVARSLSAAVSLASDLANSTGKKIFVIGGRQVYAEALERGLADKLILTKIHHKYSGDISFPEIDLEKFVIESGDTESERVCDENTGASMNFVTYKKVAQ